MSSIRKISVFVLIVMGTIGVVLFTRDDVQRRMPRTPLPIIESDVVYAISMSRSDAPNIGNGGGIAGVQQDFRIRLKAGKMFMIETAVGWLEMGVSLYEDGRQLGEVSCGYRARCRFFVEMPKDGWGTLRIRGEAGAEQEPFSLEVRQVKNAFYRGEPSGRSGILQAASIPIIDFDVVYDGTMLASDAPLYWSGGGGAQDYQVHLKAGQPVLVQAKSAGFDIGVGIYGEERRLGLDFDIGVSPRACVQVEAPKDGLYTLRVMAPDVQELKAGSFTLEVSRTLSSEQSCDTDSR